MCDTGEQIGRCEGAKFFIEAPIWVEFYEKGGIIDKKHKKFSPRGKIVTIEKSASYMHLEIG